jgi:hypothetical protein
MQLLIVGEIECRQSYSASSNKRLRDSFEEKYRTLGAKK